MSNLTTPLIPSESPNPIDTPKNWKWKTMNIILTGIGFLVVFTSFNTTENYITSMYGHYGMISLAIIYISFACFGLFVPLILRRIGEKWSLLIGGIVFVPFIFINVFLKNNLLLLFSIFIGFGQALVWCSQGSLMTRCSKVEKRGRNSGIFFFVYQLNQIIGNCIAMILIHFNIEFKLLFLILTITCLIGILPFCFIRMDILPQIEKVSILSDLRSIRKVLISRNMLLLIPLFIYSGMSQSFIYGEVTMMFGVNELSKAMFVFGVVNTLTSIIVGKVSDIVGKIPILILSAITITLGLIAINLHFFLNPNTKALLFTAVICIGLSDAGFNTQIDILLGRYFSFEADAAFAGFLSIQSSVSGLSFPLFILLGMLVNAVSWYHFCQSLMLLGLLCFAFISLFVLNKKDPIEKRK
ncbi:UNC93-like protein MFSD11 [Entamoeba marina]